MSLTASQIKEMRALAIPLMKWLEANGHPHCQIVMDSTTATVSEGLATVLKDPPAIKEDGE